MTPAELSALRDRVSRELLSPRKEETAREAAGRQALAALREAERRYRATGYGLSDVCIYCGVPVRGKHEPPTCILHRDLPALDPHFTS